MLNFARRLSGNPAAAAAALAALAIAALFLPLLLPAALALEAAIAVLLCDRRGAAAMWTALLAARGVLGLVLVALGLGAYWPLTLALAAAAGCAAWALVRSDNLAVGLFVLFPAAALGLVGVYATLPDPTAWWAERLDRAFGAGWAGQGPLLDAAVVQNMARLMTPALAALFQWSAGAGVLLGRSLSRRLAGGGLRAEFYRLQLGRIYSAAAAASVALSAFTDGALWLALSVAAVTPFLFQGLAVAHALVAARGLGRGLLVMLYAALVLIGPVRSAVTVVGLIDPWLDLRRRLAPRRDEDEP